MHSAFIRNESHSAAAASFHDESAAWVLESLFEDNVSSSSGRALTFWIPRPNLVDRCTLVGNVAGHYQFVMENTIVAFSIQGPGVASHEGYAELACCDIFGNAGGDWVGTTVTPTTWGLIKALYGEAHLSDGSPAAPDADR
jgi:hypothetical protein